MKKITKILALVLALVMVLSCFAACKKNPTTDPTTGKDPTTPTDPNTPKAPATYTDKGYTTALGINWNPHTWETDPDSTIMGYLETPLATMSIKDSVNGIYQWVFKAATSVTDVTKVNKSDLTKYNVSLPAGVTVDDVEKGYVFEIKLNPNMKWENGVKINADTYIYSMKALLDPAMRNYRANLYYSGESAVAGGSKYFNSGAPIYEPMVPAYEETPDYSYDLDAGIAAGKVFMIVSEKLTLVPYTINTLINDYNPAGKDALKAITNEANPYGATPVTAKNLDAVKKLLAAALVPFGITWDNLDAETQKAYLMESLFVFNDKYGEKYEYDGTVGCYKVDEYTIRYVTQSQIDYYYFLTSCTSNWLVYEELYEKGKDTTGALTTTNYGTSKETSMSYGPYKIQDLQLKKQIIFVQNENYYQYTKLEDGTLYGETDYEVDGKKVQAYKTTKVVIDVMTEEAAKQAFLKGELTSWTPSADEFTQYTTSEQMYQVDETYTYSFFFNTNVDKLQEMDKSKGNTNSVVLSNDNFRKAFSLAINRQDWVTATEGYKPAYSLMNNMYFYDVYNDPSSVYRKTDEAMQAICDLYGVQYGPDKAYKTLVDAYNSINGYNLTEAKNLMKIACDELVAAGLYTKGQEIKIRIAYSAGELTSANQSQVAKVNQYLNAAMEGSGFGKITLEAVGKISSRHDKVPAGEYAIGYGAWGGAAFYPFRNMQVYCDTEQNKVNELGCWAPQSETLTININGEDVTMTWQDWSRALVGNGPYANASFDVKLQVTSTMEKEFLKKYYRIPLAASSAAFLMSYQVSYFTEEYNIMYGFGGLELLQWNYSDAEWAAYIAKAGGTLVY